ncbi:MAG: hypothetical protein DRP11_00060 [Candidatus Aenigmatarchaeota archaeon]|mgnify:CR=1 FL=1|nr:MAG: hypothetical protein DRP11_00060 [Candidatus Aenigmarchaeota archaeon]
MIDEIFGMKRTEAKLSKEELPLGQVGTESFPETLERVDKKELEACYIRDPIVFNGINLILKTFLGTGFEIHAVSGRVKQYIEQLRQNTDLEQLMLEIIRDICIYGDAWVELLYSGNRITGLRIINAKSMDFEKDINGKVKLDKYGRPIGYFQKVSSASMNRKLDIDDQGNLGIRIPLEKVAHFKLYSVSGSLYGIGLIEPIYNIVKTKLNVEEGHGQASYRLGYPLPVLTCGDENHQPTAQDLNQLAEAMKDLTAKSIITLPYWNKLEISYPKGMEKISQPLNYYVSQIVSGLGVPGPLVLGSGERTNRSTLQMQIRVFKDTIRMIQEVIADAFRTEIFKRIAKIEGWNELPTIKWKELSLEDLQAKAERFNIYVKSGILKPSELAESVKELEGLK